MELRRYAKGFFGRRKPGKWHYRDGCLPTTVEAYCGIPLSGNPRHRGADIDVKELSDLDLASARRKGRCSNCVRVILSRIEQGSENNQ